MKLIDAPMQRRSLASADGTTLACYVLGSGPKRWIMPPAMGAPVVAMKHVFERFQHEYTIATWDMRGFHGSAAPPNSEAYAIDDHVADLVTVRRALGWDRFVLGGWSMGVQVSLEYHRRHADHVRALVLINGPFERILDAVVPYPGLARLAVSALRLARHTAPIANPMSRRALALPGFGRALERAGLLARRGEHFDAVVAEFRHIDWGRYFTVMRKLHEHSAAAHLPAVRVPTLITAGGRDRMTPVATAAHMHRVIVGSELFVLPEGTHYMPIEFPQPLGERLAAFLSRHDAAARPA